VDGLSAKFFGARHGHSLANASGKIVSSLENGVKPEYTLSSRGEDEVRQSAIAAKTSGMLDADVVIVSSPFSRCRRTAEIIKEVLGAEGEIMLDERLRERGFGDYELMPNENYAVVWKSDRIDPRHTESSVESAAAVQARTLELVKELDSRFPCRKIVLVSHGDALQILETGMRGISPAAHRDLEHLQTAEIRPLDFVA
jgi:broad specificity phosphatase PhoE